MKRSTLAAFLIVIAVAIFFRTYRIGELPPGLFIDEAQNGLDAATIQRGEQFPVWMEVEGVEARGREPMFHYLMALVFTILGPSAVAIRLTSSLIGIATVAAFFLMCNKLLGTRYALVAGLLLASCRWHVHFSRFGLRAILVPLWIVLTILALLRVRDRPNAVRAGALGAILGLGFYTYPPYWIVPPIVGVLVVLGGRPWKKDVLRERTKPLVVAVVAMAIVAGPIAAYSISHPDKYLARVIETTKPVLETRDWSILDNAQRVASMFHFRGDQALQHNIPGAPQLDPITGLMFLAGLYLAIRRVARGDLIVTGAFLLALLPLLPSVVTAFAPHALRTLGAVPGIIFLAALSMEAYPARMEPRRSRFWTMNVIVSLLLIGSIATNYHQYFKVWAGHESLSEVFDAGTVDFFEFLADSADENEVFVSSYIDSPVPRFLNLQRRIDMRPMTDPDFLLATRESGRDHVIATESTYHRLLVESLYPQVEVMTRFRVYADSPGRVYRIPASMLKTSLTPDQLAVARWLLEAEHERVKGWEVAW